MTLQVKNMVKHFGGVHAVKGVSFNVLPGECVALIGPNGAGKSTTFACIAGQHRLTSGEVLWNGECIDTWPPARRLMAGIARTFQVAQTFEALTVLQNVQLTMSIRRGLSAFSSLDSVEMVPAMALLAQVGLQPLASAEVLGLPYGAKKRLELAMALAGISSVRPELVEGFFDKLRTGIRQAQPERDGELARADTPKLLLLDEPAAGLAGPERASLMVSVKSLAATGMAVLYTEHNMDAVFGVADRVLVLIDGQLAAQGTPDDVAANPEVRSRYLGKSFGQSVVQPVTPQATHA